MSGRRAFFLPLATTFVVVMGVAACAPAPRHPTGKEHDGMGFVTRAIRPWPTPSAPTRLAFTAESASRVSIYDNALVSLLLLQRGDRANAGRILEALTRLQRPDGSLPFSFDAAHPAEASAYVRSGALAWVGFAAVTYLNTRGDEPGRDAIARMARGAAEYLIERQVANAKDDLRGGLVTGGSGAFVYSFEHGLVRQRFIERKIEWTSTEHNIDAFFFLRALARMSGDARYADAAERIRSSLAATSWSAELGQLVRGVSRGSRDNVLALDCASWGALMWIATGDDARASAAITTAESRFASSDTRTHVRGHKPYATGPLVEDEDVARANGLTGLRWEATDAVWPEGSAGVALALLRSGARDRARAVIAALEPLRDRDGALPAMTLEVPFELDDKPSLAGTVWVELVREELDHPERASLVWPR